MLSWRGWGKEKRAPILKEIKFTGFDETSTHYAEKVIKKLKTFIVHYFICKLIKQLPEK